MKKLALAPAVALAITGLAAAPALATPTLAAPTLAAQSGSYHVENIKGAEDNPADSGNDGSFEETDLGVTGFLVPEKISQTAITETGVAVTLKGLQNGDLITNSLTGTAEVTIGSRFEFNLLLRGTDPSNVKPGVVKFNMTVQRAGTDKQQTIPFQFEIVKDGEDDGDETPAVDPKLKLAKTEMSVSEFDEHGLEFVGEGFTPNDSVYIYGWGSEVPFSSHSYEADEKGVVKGIVPPPNETQPRLTPGEYSAEGFDVRTKTRTEHVSFTLTEDDDAAAGGADDNDNGKDGDNDGKDNGADGNDNDGNNDGGDSADNGADGNDNGSDGGNDNGKDGGDTADNDADGKNAGDDGAKDGGNDKATAAADHDGAKNGDNDGSKDGDPVADPTLSVTPKTISPTDFVNKNKGVGLTVENCEPGADIRFTVNPKADSNVTAFDKTVKADDEGKASVNVYGTDASKADTYAGDYTVKATCGDAKLTGAFTVGDDAKPGGSDGDHDGAEDGGSNSGSDGGSDGKAANGGSNGGNDGNAANGSATGNADGGGNGGGDLPRTGAELTGLAAGAGLLVVGGIAVTMTMRRRKNAQSPTSI